MMSKTQWMVLLMVAAIGVVGCNKSDEETAKDLVAAEEAADAQEGAKPKEMVDAVKPAIKALTEGMENNEAVADAVAAVASSNSLGKVIQDQSPTEEIASVQEVAETKDVADAAKPMLGALTEGTGNNRSIASAVAAVAPSDSHDKLNKDKLVLMAAMTGVLEGVTDKATAEKSQPELEALVKKAVALKARAEKMGEPTAEEENGMTEKYGAQEEEVTGKLMAQIMRLMEKPEAMAVLQKSMSGMMSK
jgi:hypothetical protein